MIPDATRISVITPSLNRVHYLVDALQTVVAQGYLEVEHIIVDGGSTDGTLAALSKYPHLKVVSGPDQGMYDALNKGLELASGEIVGFLNSDDLYAESVFFDIARKFQDDRILAVAGEANVFFETSAGVREIVGRFSPDSANLLELSTIGSPFFNAWFFRRSVFEKIGSFKSNYRIAADREFMLRFALSGLEYATLDKLVYHYRQHAGSMTFDITDQKLERIVNEQIYMADAYLQRSDLPGRARIMINQLATRDTFTTAFRSLRRLNVPKCIYYMQRAIAHDPRWLLELTQRAIRRLQL